MRNKLSSAVLILTIFLLPFSALAHDATITILRIGGIEVVPGVDTPVVVPSLPYVINFEGLVAHETQGNLNKIVLSATVNGEPIYGPETFKGFGNGDTADFTIPWTVEAPGQYVIAITGVHSDHTASGDCKAAPAIANNYLHDQGQAANTGGTNVISAVAKETGQNGSLWAKEKCEPEYFSKTITFVLDTLAE